MSFKYYFFTAVSTLFLLSTTFADDSTDNSNVKEKTKYPLDVKFSVGGSISSGNNSTRIATLDSEIQKRYTRFRVRMNSRGAYGEASYSDGPWIESTNNWLVNGRVDWFTTTQLLTFLFTEGAIQSNQYRGFWLKKSVQGGYGIRLFNKIESVDFGLPIGIDYAREVLVVDNGQKPEKFSAVLKPELNVKINSNLRYRIKSNFFLDLQDEDDYRIDAENILDMKMSERFSLRMAYTVNHHNKPRLIREVDQSGNQTGNQIPAKPTDRLFSTSVLISF